MRTKSISCLSIGGGWALCQESITELARTVHWTVRLVRTLLAEHPSAPDTTYRTANRRTPLRSMR